jgi:general secretion pathway protein G
MRATGVRGFTLIEMLAVMAIIGTLTAFAMPHYHAIRDKALIAQAEGDIRALEVDIMTYYAGANLYPADLATIGRGSMVDPWGNPYQYLPAQGGNQGQMRKDRFLVPLNSDYDLYSMGPDGKSSPALTSSNSQDDIVRANDGAYVGLASTF